MRKGAVAATTAAVLGLFVVALPASADPGVVGGAASIDWRLVVIFTAIALAAFYYVLELMGRRR